SSRRRHTRSKRDWSSDVCSSDLLIAKENGVIAGIGFAQRVFAAVDKELELTVFKSDGDLIQKGDIIFHISGKSQSILKSERLMRSEERRVGKESEYRLGPERAEH